MMTLKKLLITGVVAGLFAGLAACGGGSGGGATTVSRLVAGPISAFGSIYVNSTRYNTDNATVYIEGKPASESALRVGMRVTIKESSPGVAESVHYGDDLEGIVITNNVTVDGTLDVMGQIVTIDSKTVFESHVPSISTVDAIAPGNIVEVSGNSSGLGTVTATRIEVKAVDLATYLLTHPEGIEVKGIIGTHTMGDQTFTIGSLTVAYSGADISDMPAGDWSGLYVEAKSTQALNPMAQMVAYKVELENEGSMGMSGDDDDEMEVYGEVAAVSNTSVTVNGQVFLLDANTKYDHGTAADLVVGAMVEVEGKFNANAELVAKEIEFEEDKTESELKANVDSISLADTNSGTIIAGGKTILVTNATIMHDSSSAKVNAFNLSMLGTGDYVEVKLADNGDGTFTAIRLEREDPPVVP